MTEYHVHSTLLILLSLLTMSAVSLQWVAPSIHPALPSGPLPQSASLPLPQSAAARPGPLVSYNTRPADTPQPGDWGSAGQTPASLEVWHWPVEFLQAACPRGSTGGPRTAVPGPPCTAWPGSVFCQSTGGQRPEAGGQRRSLQTDSDRTVFPVCSWRVFCLKRKKEILKTTGKWFPSFSMFNESNQF